MTDCSKFSSISYNQVIRPKVTQRLDVRLEGQNSAADKENAHASTPVGPLSFAYNTSKTYVICYRLGTAVMFTKTFAKWSQAQCHSQGWFIVSEPMERFMKPQY
jgi:hypothetical protein